MASSVVRRGRRKKLSHNDGRKHSRHWSSAEKVSAAEKSVYSFFKRGLVSSDANLDKGGPIVCRLFGCCQCSLVSHPFFSMTFLQVMGCDLCIRNDVASPGSRRSFGRVFARENHQSLDLKYWALVRKRTYLGWGGWGRCFSLCPWPLCGYAFAVQRVPSNEPRRSSREAPRFTFDESFWSVSSWNLAWAFLLTQDNTQQHSEGSRSAVTS